MLFKIINNLYTVRNNHWIKNLENKDIQPLIINRFLNMNSKVNMYTSYLDRYTYNLSVKHWLLLAWSIIPKYSKTPFIPYVKKLDLIDDYDDLWFKIKKYFKAGDNDMIHIKKYLLPLIQSDQDKWFTMFGMNKDFWLKHNVNYDNIRSSGIREGKSGLELFGL